jgi:hypothetical protein
MSLAVTEQFLIIFDLTMFLKSRGEGYPTRPRALRAAFACSKSLSVSPPLHCCYHNHGTVRGVVVVQTTRTCGKDHIFFGLGNNELTPSVLSYRTENLFFTSDMERIFVMPSSLNQRVP